MSHNNMNINKGEQVWKQFEAQCQALQANHPQMDELDVTMLPINDDMALYLGECLTGNTNLVQLHLPVHHRLTARGAKALVRAIQSSSLRKLVLEGCEEEMPTHLAVLYTETIPKVKRLQLLLPICDHHATLLGDCLTNTSMEQVGLLICNNLTSRGTLALAKGIRNCRLMHLELIPNSTGTDVAAQHMRLLYEHGMQGHATLQYLTIFNRLCDIPALAASLKNIASLTILEARDELSVLPTLQLFCDQCLSASKLVVLRLVECGFQSEHMRLLATAGRIGNHPTLKKLDIGKNSLLGDDGVAAFVEHWHDDSDLREIVWTENNVSGVGAQRWVQASAKHPKLVKLDLSDNKDIGYEGLVRIGKEILQGTTTLQVLELNRVNTWYAYGEKNRDKASLQWTQCEQASQALLEAVRGNSHLKELHLDNVHIVPNIQFDIDAGLRSNRSKKSPPTK